MKTIIFNGSPHKNGDTMALVNEIVENLHGDVRIVHSYYAGIAPCTDCHYCWQKPGCAIKDDMQQIYADLEEADNVIIASPLHLDELSGSLLALTSRLQTYWSAIFKRNIAVPVQKSKQGVLVMAAGSEYDNMFDDSIRRTKIMFKTINTTLNHTVFATNADGHAVRHNMIALAKAREVAGRLRVPEETGIR